MHPYHVGQRMANQNVHKGVYKRNIITHNTTTSKFQVHNDNKINLIITIPKIK